MNKAKQKSKKEGLNFLCDAFGLEQKVLAQQISLSSNSITHDGIMGEVNEEYFIEFLKKYLPKRYSIDRGIIIDSNGNTSDQIDIVIFDNQYTPTLLDQKKHRYITVEAVYCIIEVKATINKAHLDYASKKIKSVLSLERTSIPIPHAGGIYPKKALFPIVSAIIAPKIEWIDGFNSRKFREYIDEFSEIDAGLALESGAFDKFDGSLVLIEQDNALLSFVFRLLEKLQSLGTVPAIDWNKYARVLGEI